MIASSFMAKSAAVGMALALHGALIWGLKPVEHPPETEGATAAIETRLGDSFADMAQGVLAPEPVRTPALKPVQPTQALQPAPSNSLTSEAATVAALPAAPVAAQPVDTPSPSVSRRPEQRPKTVEAKAKPKPQPGKPKPGAKKAATKGASDGNPDAAPKPKSTGAAKTNKAGNATANAYPGKVMRKIARVPKPRISSTGAATVSFTIAKSGGLASVAIARSSGTPSLDQAALKVIRRAAPFPKPPAGAQRSFTLKIEGKP